MLYANIGSTVSHVTKLNYVIPVMRFPPALSGALIAKNNGFSAFINTPLEGSI
jgi:hypothetical protein